MQTDELIAFFRYLNSHSCYLILRNWEDLFDDSNAGASQHEDIDVLCDDLLAFVSLTGAKPVHGEKNRDNYVIPIGTDLIRFDIRSVGDGYYPEPWEKRMLERRILSDNGVFVMHPEDYYFSLLYHALLQKPSVSNEYLSRLKQLSHSLGNERISKENLFIASLKTFLSDHRYKVEIPRDPGVYLQWATMRKMGYQMSLRRLAERLLFKVRKKIA